MLSYNLHFNFLHPGFSSIKSKSFKFLMSNWLLKSAAHNKILFHLTFVAEAVDGKYCIVLVYPSQADFLAPLQSPTRVVLCCQPIIALQCVHILQDWRTDTCGIWWRHYMAVQYTHWTIKKRDILFLTITLANLRRFFIIFISF